MQITHHERDFYTVSVRPECQACEVYRRVKAEFQKRSNEVCKEIGFIPKGSGTLTTEKQTVSLSEGDAVLINAGEKYFWQGNMMWLLPTAPAWYGAQHK